MMNRPNSKNYKRNRRAKRSNPLFVWLFVLLAMLITVPIQAVDSDHEEEIPASQIEEQEIADAELAEEE